jgi:hypothetical protein
VNCPSCGRALTTQTAGPITVDVCSGGCGGIWFDHFELAKVDEKSESAGEVLLNVSHDPSLSIDLTRSRACPKCGGGVTMLRHFTSIARKVTIDECPNCGGVFLDAGELAGIRSEYANDEERHRAAEAYFSELFDGDLAAARAQSEAGLARAQRFARAFRFICPSEYLKGKQDWGAF